MTRKKKEKAQAGSSHQVNHKEEKGPKMQEDTSAEHIVSLEVLRNEKDEIFNKLQRVSADYANFQKRVQKQIADSLSYEKEVIIKSLLPVLDNFEHTLKNAPTVEGVESLVRGVKIIYDQMLDILRSHGVEQIKASGEKFDPALHEAVMPGSEPEKPNHTVLQEFQKGYKLNGRVIRPSKVVVNKVNIEQPAENLEEGEQKNGDESETTDLAE